MTILIDTPIWSLAYRRKQLIASEQQFVDEFKSLVQNHQAAMVGPVRQEVLSGLRDIARWDLLRTTLRAFDDLPLNTDDFECAADFFNRCRREGIQGSQTDFLLCAVAVRLDTPIFTTDRDFARYAKYVKIRIHRPRADGNASDMS